MGFEILLSLAKIQIIRYNLRGKRELLSIQSKMFFFGCFIKNSIQKKLSKPFFHRSSYCYRKKLEMTIFHSMILYEGGFL